MQLIEILVAEMHIDRDNPGSFQRVQVRQGKIPVRYGACWRFLGAGWQSYCLLSLLTDNLFAGKIPSLNREVVRACGAVGSAPQWH